MPTGNSSSEFATRPHEALYDSSMRPNVFCIFVGYERSGHSLIGALLDAHPDVVVSHEANVLSLIEDGKKKTEIFAAILDNSRRHAMAGRRETGYSYAVPGQWQGRFRTLAVIGDKKGGRTTAMLHEKPSLLDQLIATLDGIPLRMFHVVRNPFDNIATMLTRQRESDPGATLDGAIARYFTLAATVHNTRQRIGPGAILDVWHEDVIADASREVRRMCDFLGVAAEPDYVQACAAIVYAKPNKTRFAVQWESRHTEAVLLSMQQYPFLSRYAPGE